MAVPRSPASGQAPPRSEPQTPAGGRKVARELFGLSLLFWGLFVLLTLITHSQSDPGINHVVSTTMPIKNGGGMFGAYVSGLLVDLFGFASFVWPLVFLAWGAGCVSTWFTMPWWRWFGFFVLGACFITFGTGMSFGVGDVRGGGMLGASLYTWGRANLSPAGAGLAWLFMLLISMELAFGISWMTLLTRGWGFAKEKAEANDITVARITETLGETLRRYAPRGKREEDVIPLLELTTDSQDDVPAPLSYADVSSAELAEREVRIAEEIRLSENTRTSTELAAMKAAEEAARAVIAQSLASSQLAGASTPVFSGASTPPPPVVDPVDQILRRMAAEQAAARQADTPPASAPILPEAPIPDGFLGQTKPVDLNRASTSKTAKAPTAKSVTPSPLSMADSPASHSLFSGIKDGIRGLFGSKATQNPMPEPVRNEPIISLTSVLPDAVPTVAERPMPVLVSQPPLAPTPVMPQPAVAEPPKPVFPVLKPPTEPVSPSEPYVDPIFGRASGSDAVVSTTTAPAPVVAPAPKPAPVFEPEPTCAPAPPVAPTPVFATAPTVAPEPIQPHQVRPVSFAPPWAEAAKPKLPPLSMLQASIASDRVPDMDLMAEKGEQLLTCLGNFGIRAELVRITPGPVVTMFEIRPAPGTKVSRILNLNQDLALALKALAVRIHPIPGEDTLGIEIPNEQRATVNFRKILESAAFQNSESLLTLALGADIGGSPIVADLAKMPHLLVGGATGAGKSVCVNSLLVSLLCKASPDELKLLMVDPKVVELAMYADLPHLIHPVVTETQIAKNALEWAVHEMEQRYKRLAQAVVRNIAGYNQKAVSGTLPADLEDHSPMPYLVIVVDELSDLMMSAGKDVETAIVRLAQLARACGIHLIIATQRPSVDVVTGLIKANFPSRIAFQVTSAHDSRTILDTIGAELLLGKGDMLFKPSGSKPRRLHGPFVSDEDVQAVVDFWKSQRQPDYSLDFTEWGSPTADSGKLADTSGISAEDTLYGEIVQFALEEGKKLSISKLQRRFRIGFNKAAGFMERMEQDGIIQPAGHANRSREVL